MLKLSICVNPTLQDLMYFWCYPESIKSGEKKWRKKREEEKQNKGEKESKATQTVHVCKTEPRSLLHAAAVAAAAAVVVVC